METNSGTMIGRTSEYIPDLTKIVTGFVAEGASEAGNLLMKSQACLKLPNALEILLPWLASEPSFVT